MNDWEVVYRGPQYQADLLKAVLEAHDIPALLLDDTPYGPLMNSRLLVPPDRVADAIRLLETPPETPDDAPDDAAGETPREV